MEEKNVSLAFTINGMPIRKFKEWQADCKHNYSNIYWAKLWENHLTNKNYAWMEELNTQINILSDRINELENYVNELVKPEKTKKRQTLGV